MYIQEKRLQEVMAMVHRTPKDEAAHCRKIMGVRRGNVKQDVIDTGGKVCVNM